MKIYDPLHDSARPPADVPNDAALLQSSSSVPVPAPTESSNAPDLHASAVTDVALPDNATEETPPLPFPTDALPAGVADIIRNVACSERVPDALPAVIALGILSASIGAGLEVQSGPQRTTRGNLFFLASAESGSGKSECFRLIAKPLLARQEQIVEHWRTAIAPKIQTEIRTLESQLKKLDRLITKTNDPTELDRLKGEMEYKLARQAELKNQSAAPLLIAQDTTTERLAVLLQMNGEVIFSTSSDARKLCDNLLGRYSANKMTDESLYLCGYSGDHVRVDRQGRDPVTLRRPALSLLWLVQPDALDLLLNESSLSQSGFLPRCLIVHTRAEPQRIEGGAESVPDDVRTRWTALVTELLNTYRLSPTAPSPAEPRRIIQPTPEALARLNAYHNEIVARRRADLHDLTSYAARWAEQAWRLAVVLHAALPGAGAHEHPLADETAANAIRLAQWFADQQLDTLARSRRQAANKKEDEVLEFLEERRERTGKDHLTARDVHHARIVSTAEAARALVTRMEADGLLIGQDVKPERGGRATRIYRAAGRNPVPA